MFEINYKSFELSQNEWLLSVKGEGPDSSRNCDVPGL